MKAIVAYSPDSSPADYDRSLIASTEIDVNSSGRPWTFQYCTEFGWYQTRSPYDYLRTPLVNEQYFAGMCSAAFSDLDWTNLPKATESQIDLGGSNMAATNVFFANGGEDPWQWATQLENRPELNQLSRLSDCNGCGHCAELYTPQEDDPEELK